MNRCNISFAISRVEDCLELNFKYVDYQTLAHLSYSSCACLTSVRPIRAQRFLSVRVLISDSIQILDVMEHVSISLNKMGLDEMGRHQSWLLGLFLHSVRQ